MDELDDILDDTKHTEEAPASQPRDESGRFAPKGEEKGVEQPQEAPQGDPQAQDPVPPTDEPKGLPKDVYEPLKAVRSENTELKNRLAALEQQLQSQQQPKQQEAPPPPPSVWEDDQAAFQHWARQTQQGAVQQATFEARMNMSEMMARQAYADFDEVWGPMNEFLVQNPSLIQQAQGSAHPWDAAYKAYKNHKDENGVAFASGQPSGGVRDAGAGATATKGDTMSRTDEALDETFPASDATAKY